MQSNKNLKSNAEANFFFFLCRAVNENGVDIRSQRIVFVMNLSLSCGEDGGRGGGRGGIDSQCIVLKTAEGDLQGKGWKRIAAGRSRGGGGIDSQCIVVKSAEEGLRGRGWKGIAPGRSLLPHRLGGIVSK